MNIFNKFLSFFIPPKKIDVVINIIDINNIKKENIKRIPKIKSIIIDYVEEYYKFSKLYTFFDTIENVQINISEEWGQEFQKLPFLPKIVKHLQIKNITFPLQKNLLHDQIQCLSLSFQSSQKLQKGILPNSLLYLKLENNFNEKLAPNVLPNSILELDLSYEYNQKLEKSVLPSSLKKLYFGNKFNQILEPGVFPNTLLCLKLDGCYNHPFRENVLPESLIFIHIGNKFNQPIYQNILPLNLQCIYFGESFNQKIDFTVFSHMSHLAVLIFEKSFNQKIDFHLLPLSLKYLYLNGIQSELQITFHRQKPTLTIYNYDDKTTDTSILKHINVNYLNKMEEKNYYHSILRNNRFLMYKILLMNNIKY